MTARLENMRQNVVCGIVLLLQHSYKCFHFFLPCWFHSFFLLPYLSSCLLSSLSFSLMNTFPTGFVVNFKHCLYENRKRNEAGLRSLVIAEVVFRGLFTYESGT